MLVPQARLAIENLALRQQVAVFKQSVKRPKLRRRDRLFWVWLSKLWPNWPSALVMVQLEVGQDYRRTEFSAWTAVDRGTPHWAA
jgi:hypothetical protein